MFYCSIVLVFLFYFKVPLKKFVFHIQSFFLSKLQDTPGRTCGIYDITTSLEPIRIQYFTYMSVV